MKPTDLLLSSLALKAGVRPPHLYHCWAVRRQLGEAFNVANYAAFAMMEERHVTAMVAVLDTLPQPKQRVQRERATKTLLSEAWQMPEDWLVIGCERRFWPLDVCRTEADKFANWHRMKGNAFADWKAAWRNWVDGSHRENGKASVNAAEEWTPEARQAYLAKLK